MGTHIVRSCAGDVPDAHSSSSSATASRQWNLENRFTGWWDVDVTEKGAAEGMGGG
jgi:hypothetical protein